MSNKKTWDVQMIMLRMRGAITNIRVAFSRDTIFILFVSTVEKETSLKNIKIFFNVCTP